MPCAEMSDLLNFSSEHGQLQLFKLVHPGFAPEGTRRKYFGVITVNWEFCFKRRQRPRGRLRRRLRKTRTSAWLDPSVLHFGVFYCPKRYERQLVGWHKQCFVSFVLLFWDLLNDMFYSVFLYRSL